MPDFMGFMGQQSEEKGEEDDEVVAKQPSLEQSAAASGEEHSSSAEEKEVSPVKVEEKETEPARDREQVEEVGPAENTAEAESDEIHKEKYSNYVQQSKIDTEKEVSEVVEDYVPREEIVEETKSSVEEEEVTTESKSHETEESDGNVERETEPVALEISPHESDNVSTGEMKLESEEKGTAVVPDVAGEEMTSPEPVLTSVAASEPVKEEPKREDTEKEDKKEGGEKVVSSHVLSESETELEKLRKEMKMMEAALQGAARQAQVLEF